MHQRSEQSFSIAEEAVGYPLLTQSTALSRRVEQADRWVLEVTEIWSGVVQHVCHISPQQNVAGVTFRDGLFEVLHEGSGTYFVERCDRSTEVITPGQRFYVARDTVVHVRTGTHHVLYRVVPAARRIAFDPISWIDGPFLGVLAVACGLGIAILTLVMTLPGNPVVEAQEIGDRFARVMLAKQKPPRQQPKRTRAKRLSAPEAGRSVSRVTKPGSTRRNLGKRVLQENVNFGLIKAMKRGSVLAPFQVDQGLINAITVQPKGNASGKSLLGSRSSGFGSGDGVDTAPGGGSLTAGLGVSQGGAIDGKCSGPDGLCEKEAGRVSVKMDSMIAVGSLSRSEIDEVVKSNLRRIKYCYQRQMQVDPSLSGKVTTRFTVSNDGSVGTARVIRSSMGSDAVDRCLVKTLFGMTFPRPRGGGQVMVTYPFTFEAS